MTALDEVIQGAKKAAEECSDEKLLWWLKMHQTDKPYHAPTTAYLQHLLKAEAARRNLQ